MFRVSDVNDLVASLVAWANDESKMDTDAMEALQQRTLLIVPGAVVEGLSSLKKNMPGWLECWYSLYIFCYETFIFTRKKCELLFFFTRWFRQMINIFSGSHLKQCSEQMASTTLHTHPFLLGAPTGV